MQPGVFAPGAGHGTFVTGCVLRHAPEATIRQYRAVDAWGFGSSWRLKDCIKQAVQDGCQVINISLGFEDPDLIGSPAISAALHAVPSSVVVVAAAGNSGTAIPMLPASHTRAVGVGGLKGDLNPVAWSNYGPWVDFSAVAMPVVSLYVEDITDPQQDPWGMWAGTSFAAPKVAGELAGFVGEGAAPSDALDRLRARSARPFPSPDYGYVLDLDDDDAAAYVLAFPPQ
jgi:thermitase